MGKIIRVLGTGGTIAGTASPGAAEERYRAGQVAIHDLLAPVLPSLGGLVDHFETVQVAQIDSRNMSHAVWQALAAEVQAGQDHPDVVGQVITHGTDTLEETAVFLNGVVHGDKPLVMTAAMRPANSPQADGPAHLVQAVHLAADRRAQGVLMAFGGNAWRAVHVRKVHPFAMAAFSGGDAPALAQWTGQSWQWAEPANTPIPVVMATRPLPTQVDEWPIVEIIHSHAGASGRVLQALLDQPGPKAVTGIVVAATGNGSVHDALHEALQVAVDSGRLSRRAIVVATRCITGSIVGEPEHGWPVAAGLTPAQARVALMLQLLGDGDRV